MKKQYIQPEVEITLPMMESAILGVSMDMDGEHQGTSGDGGDDNEGGIDPEINRFNLWEE
ncbi:MAG: hypothetical protein J5637_02670 [Prevotella sp.]|nr:hypothetical protein [Prevotella sp.]